MEATVLSVGKSVLDGALGYAKSAIVEEVALQLGVQRDLSFISDELEMMRSFLMAADQQERDQHKVLKTWVKQVRDLAYDVEDCLQDFALHLNKPSRWRLPRTLRERHRIANKMKELRARVEDVSQRNLRYHLIEGPASKHAEQPSTSSAAIFGIDEAKNRKKAINLKQLITHDANNDLRVIAVWGTSGDVGKMSIVWGAYHNHEVKSKFGCRAWVRLMHPFNPSEFLISLVRQFYGNSREEIVKAPEGTTVGVDVLKKMAAQDDVLNVFNEYVNQKSYLVVINDLSTLEDWDWIKSCFPDRKNGSRIIVSTQQVEIASLCTDQPYQVSELKQWSSDQPLYAFHNKGCQHATDSTNPTSSSNISMNEIQVDQPKGVINANKYSNLSLGEKTLPGSKTMATVWEEAQLIGREREKSKIIQLISDQDGQKNKVISVWGMGGLGKTTLIRSIYESQEFHGKFQKHAWITVLHPFNLQEFLRNLVSKLLTDSPEEMGKVDVSVLGGGKQKKLAMMETTELTTELANLLEQKNYLIVLDDISSTVEWDQILPYLPRRENVNRIIITTREESIARHCSVKHRYICKLEGLEDKDALDLFQKKVFKEAENFHQHPELVEQAELILKKCGGLPLAIVTIGGFLANQPKTALEWRKLNEHISAELEINPEFGIIRTVLTKSYDGLPYHLKSCFLYLSIFPEDHIIRRRRLVQRWIAEGYLTEMRKMTAEKIGDNYFTKLIDRSMIQPSRTQNHSGGRIDFCQVHDLIHEISISKATEENLVFVLDNSCSLNTQDKVRHLAISSSWDRDKNVYERAVDLSCIRSLTVFGEWKSFLISDKMRLLRVLDLEDTSNIRDHHLEQIGKLLHLKYLSLRECDGVFHLPDSLGNLRQLETLDVRGSRIIKLPTTIIKLQRLQYLIVDRQADGADRHDAFNIFCHVILPFAAMHLDTSGVKMPRGIGKLRALHTLGVVNVTGEKAILKELKKLTRLRKLEVTGINKENHRQLCSAITDHGCLESLMLRSEGELGIYECLDGMSSPPKDLRRLKLYGNLVKLPNLIRQLHNLAKLSLQSTQLNHDAIQVLGELPNLVVLCLMKESFMVEELHFQGKIFTSLVTLDLSWMSNLRSLKFEDEAMAKLELVQVEYCPNMVLSGLEFLLSLNQVLIKGSILDVKEDLQVRLAQHPNRPVLKML